EESRIKDLLSSFLTMEADEAGVLSRDATVTLLLIHLDRLMKQAPVREAKEHQLAQVIRYINANYTRDVTLEEIADRFFISKYHLLRRFKALTNSTVHQYILTKRILLARTLLRQGIAPAEVATQCGFSSYAGFYQAFTAQTGISPSAFQKE
ncbi:MAG: helix-turn-helix transcriptional regulator, partial [Clostridia bacterium]|nr:helix-turn-helix transcriptional regulator [Clostridia bacterium]